jgi:hypothetical protein
MLAVISALVGFLSPFLPAILKIFERRQDNVHELEMYKLRLEADAKEHLYKMEEINATADIEEAKLLHAPIPSFGVQVLDAAKDSGWGAWATVPAFYIFTFLDFLNGVIRPGVTIAIVGFYVTVKYGMWVLLTGPKYEAQGWEAVVQLWGEPDTQVLFLVLGYWFGARAFKMVYGGSSQTSAPR